MITSLERHSPNIRLNLTVEDRSIPLAQISPDWIMLREATELPPGQAVVVMDVDGRERRWDVYLAGPLCETTLKMPIQR